MKESPLISAGRAFCESGDFASGSLKFQEAVTCDPRSARGWSHLGAALWALTCYDDSVAAFSRSLELNSLQPQVWNNLGLALSSCGNNPAAIECFRQCIALTDDFPAARSNLLLGLNYEPSLSQDEIYLEHSNWDALYGRATTATNHYAGHKKHRSRPIRIGYVSGCFFSGHSNVYFFEPVLSAHSRPEFEITCYSNSKRIDAGTRRLMAYADSWRTIYGLSDDAICNLIKSDQIDILIDLSGHTEGNRLTVFARKPAPIQITWLGYPNTSGLQAIDYRISCDAADPPGLTDHLHSEGLVRLPDTFLCYKPPDCARHLDNTPGPRSGPITFGCFNNVPKICEPILEAWATILKSVENSRLLLKSRGYKSEQLRAKIARFFESRHIDSKRVEMIEFIPSISEHMQLYNQVDIGLDTWPYNGTTTTCEALWMGVPVVTLTGDTHRSRVGLTLCAAIGQADLATDSVCAYVTKAISLAHDTAKLNELRLSLRWRMSASLLMNPFRFTQNLEAEYQRMVKINQGSSKKYW